MAGNGDQFLVQMFGKWRQFIDSTSGHHNYGRSAFGFDYATEGMQDPAYRAKYFPNGRDIKTWMAALEKDFPGISRFYHAKMDKKEREAFEKDYAPHAVGESPAEIEAAKADAEKAELDLKIKAFSDELIKPLDKTDPTAIRIMEMASGDAATKARLAGVEGGLSVANSEQAANNALFGYDMQRKQLGLSALQTESGHQLNQRQQESDQMWGEYMAKRDQANQNHMNSGNIWRTVGGVGGAIVGGLAGLPGGAAGVAAGASAGWGVGSGLAGGMQGGPSYPATPGGGTGSSSGWYGGGR
jgi:hypothetical protein